MTYSEKDIEPCKQSICWRKGDLTTEIRLGQKIDRIECVTHEADRITKDSRECLENIDNRAEGVC